MPSGFQNLSRIYRCIINLVVTLAIVSPGCLRALEASSVSAALNPMHSLAIKLSDINSNVFQKNPGEVPLPILADYVEQIARDIAERI